MLYDDAGANTIKRTITMINFLSFSLSEYICYGYNLNNITGSLYRILIKNIRLFELFKILRKEIFSNDKGICF